MAAVREMGQNRSSIMNELRLAGRLGREPSLQAVGHAAAGTAVEPRRHADPDLQRMAEPVAPGNGPGNEHHVLAKRNRGDAAHCPVDVAANSEACAGVVDVARPGIVRIGIDEALQVIYQACVLEVMGGAPEEAFAEQRFLAFVADDMSTDEVLRRRCCGGSLQSNPLPGAASASVENKTECGPPMFRARSMASRRAEPTWAQGGGNRTSTTWSCRPS